MHTPEQRRGETRTVGNEDETISSNSLAFCKDKKGEGTFVRLDKSSIWGASKEIWERNCGGKQAIQAHQIKRGDHYTDSFNT